MSLTLSPARFRVSHGLGFRVVAVAFATALAFSTVPTPLYTLYQQRDGFPAFLVTVVFAAYAVGVMLSLYLAGHVSDWLGRRRVLVAGLLAEALSAAMFLLWPEVPGLIVARLVSGAGIGAITATATAHLSELRPQGRPGLVATVVNAGGLALGPLVGGLFAQYAGLPLRTPFAVFLVVLLGEAIVVSLVPETVERREERPAYRPQRLSLPSAARAEFTGAATGAFAAFALSGLFMALSPALLAHELHQPSRLLAGLAPFTMLGSAALAQLGFARLATRPQLRSGYALMGAGLVLLPVSAFAGSLPLFFGASVLAGAGFGLGFRAAVAAVAALADEGTRGEVLAALFLAAYAGLVLPVLLIGLAMLAASGPVVLAGFAVLELALLGWSARRTLGRA
ncbi:MFS transporter [Amycolatopsis australiensis]|uniref:Predicted arabinose efflux permease, MFS family n=1 Tax=Amycolatopsis australiensis TaxID=546364 RepID=A0A1K1SH92_9PSEU|nr:MFS transporter [Amycolatopsis australiensis]SFW83678.1 Predicted arabinose efflux permease, MFS family [Amycolatopsis australiensis]